MKIDKFDYVNFLLFMIFVSIFISLYLYLSEKNKDLNSDNFECQAVFKLGVPDIYMPTVAGIKVIDGKGTISFGGPVYENDSLIGAVSRRVEFDYKEDNITTFFKINKIVKFEKDNLPEKISDIILPGFFTTPNSTIYFTLKRVYGGVFFLRDNAPMFYCQYE